MQPGDLSTLTRFQSPVQERDAGGRRKIHLPEK